MWFLFAIDLVSVCNFYLYLQLSTLLPTCEETSSNLGRITVRQLPDEPQVACCKRMIEDPLFKMCFDQFVLDIFYEETQARAQLLQPTLLVAKG